MNLNSLGIPDSLPEIGNWLDDQLVSPNLIETIFELEILAGDRLTTAQSLDAVLAGGRQTILTAGLGKADEKTIQGLLRQPALLLELQEQVMMHGEEFWQKKTDDSFGKANKRSISDPINSAVPIPEHSPTVSSNKPSVTTRTSWTRKKMIGTIAALAAALLILVSLSQLWNGAAVAQGDWGFAKSGLLESNVSELEMLNRLANASSAWHNKTPANSTELSKRLQEFDEGCRSLISSNLPQLSPANRAIVHAACKECRSGISQQLAALNRGVDFNEVQRSSNELIDRLTLAIKSLT